MRTWGRINTAAASGTGIGSYAIGVFAIGESAGGGGAVGSPSSAIGSFVIGESPIGEGPDDTGYQWVEVDTDANGFNDAVWLTTLCQVLRLGLNESPIFGNWGIPAQQSVVTQILPDYYVTVTQQQFAAFFLALIVTRLSQTQPSYEVNVTATPGAILMNPVPL